MMERLTYLAGQIYYLQTPLDRDSWLDGKRGMDFDEAPPEIQEINLNSPTAPIAEWAILVRYIAIGLVAAALVFIVIRLLLKKSAKTAAAKENVKEVDQAAEGPTALSPLEELWAAHEKAKQEKNFREALRVLYQITIKHLDTHGKLQAAADKTNREYAQEMSWQEKAQDFFQLTLLHEFTWYGSNEVNQLDFDRAEPRFLAFIESIKNG